jgi:hypothetical protein
MLLLFRLRKCRGVWSLMETKEGQLGGRGQKVSEPVSSSIKASSFGLTDTGQRTLERNRLQTRMGESLGAVFPNTHGGLLSLS